MSHMTAVSALLRFGRPGALWAVTLYGLSSAVAPTPGAASPVAVPYPFEGTWIRSDRACMATATDVRSYTAREMTSARSRCTIRRVASGSGAFELLEECRRPSERPTTVTETIRMQSPDTLTLKRQVVRLKIPRSVHYIRCAIAAPAQARPVR